MGILFIVDYNKIQINDPKPNTICLGVAGEEDSKLLTSFHFISFILHESPRLGDTWDTLAAHSVATPTTSSHIAYGKHDHTCPIQVDNHLLDISHPDSMPRMDYDKYHRPAQQRNRSDQRDINRSHDLSIQT
eukprot:scaffold3547_cov145-Ochromonas_danica.AAC.1